MQLNRLLTALGLVAVLGAGWAPRAAHAVVQHNEVVAHSVSVSKDGSILLLELANGRTLRIELADGTVSFDGNVIVTYGENSTLPQRWNHVLEQAGNLSSAELLRALEELSADLAVADLPRQERVLEELARAEVHAVERAHEAARAAAESQAEAAAETAVFAAEAAEESALRQDLVQQSIQAALEALGQDIVIDLSALPESDRIIDQLDNIGSLGIQVDNALVHTGDLTVARGRTIDRDLVVVSGDVSVFGTVDGNVIALNGDVILRPSGVIEGDVITINGSVIRAGGRIGGRVRTQQGLPTGVVPNANRLRYESQSITSDSPVQLASLLGMFVALASIGFGLTFFAPRQLDVVSNTVTESFGKSFLAGMFAQPLLLPALAMLTAGLAITVVGILLIPVLLLAFAVALLGASVGGYLAVARSLGGAHLARRAAKGHAVVETPYRAMIFGLLGLMAIWAPAVALGWVPVVGQVLALLAAIFTWVMATAGFGATILSRGGLRATFVRPARIPALTDEHYWPSNTGEHRQHRSTIRDR